MAHPTWEDSFDHFRSVSNESERIAQAFAQHLLPLLDKTPAIRWGDIGCGDGAQIAKHLQHYARAGFRSPAVELIDPNLKTLLTPACLSLRLILPLSTEVVLRDTDIESFALRYETNVNVDLWTAIHSIHSPSAFEGLLTIAKCHLHSARRAIFFIVSEKRQSMIYILRRKLEQAGISLPKPCTKELARATKNLGARVHRVSIDDQYLEVDKELLANDESYFLLPFLLGETIPSYLTREASQREHLKRIAIVQLDGLKLLPIPDDALIISL